MSEDCREEFVKRIKARIGCELDPEAAQAAVDAVIRELSNYEITPRETALAVADGSNEKILKRYIACLRIDGKSEKTIAQYARECRKFAEMTGKPYTEIGPYDVRFYLADMKGRGISNRSMENSRMYLSALFRWMELEELIPRNPCATVKKIKYAADIKLPFDDAEIDKLRSACRTKKERAIIEMLLSSGIRVSELCDLDVKDIDFEKRTIRILHGKGDKERVTYFNAVAAMRMKEYMEERGVLVEPAFINHLGERIASGGIRSILKTIEKRSGVKNVHPHRFRRTFASSLAARGMNIQEIKRIMGHSSISTTMTYIYVDDIAVQMSYKKYAV